MKVAIFLVAMLLACNATTNFKKFPPMNLKPGRNIVSVLTQIEAQIKAGGPLQIINDTLDTFVNEITGEQASHDELHAQSEAACEDEFVFRRREVNDANSSLKEGSQTLSGCQDQLRRTNSDYKFIQSTLQDTRSFYEAILDRREREAIDYASEQSKYELNIHSLETALDILDEIFEGEADFIQLARHTHVMMKNAITSNKVEMFGPVFTAFASLATAQGGADNELLEQLVNILNNLKEAVEENWEERTAQEAGFQADFESLKSTLENTIAELIEETHTLEKEIGSLKKCIVFQTGIVGSATAKRDRNQNLWDDAEELCTNADDEYNSAKALRQEELEVIDQLRHKVNLRWS